MGIQFRKKLMLAKIETTYGTDPTPTGAANAIQLSRNEIIPLEADLIDRGLINGFLGVQPQLVAGLRARITAAVEIAGAGAAGTAPAYGPLFRGCGMAETITAATKVDYDPISTAYESLAVWGYLGPTLHKLAGARGAWGIEFAARALPLFTFDFLGMFVDPTNVTQPAGTFTAFKDPQPVSKLNTPTVTLDGYTAVLQSFSLSSGNVINYVDRPNRNEVELTDRAYTGSVMIELPTVSAKDFYALAKVGSRHALAITHGTAAGKIVEFTAPKVQFSNPRYADDGGTAMLSMDVRCTPNAGDDEFKISVK